MKPELSIPRITRSEQETQSEAKRLIQLTNDALAIVGTHSADDAESLGVSAERIERAARDLAYALRELARERSAA